MFESGFCVWGQCLSIQAAVTLSILSNLYTCLSVYTKAIQIEKAHFPFTSRLAIMLFAAFGTLRRVGTMAAFFVPYLGLLSLLQHWRAEQTPWKARNRTFYEGDVIQIVPIDYSADTLYLNDNITVAWSELNRADYSDPATPIPPSYTLYTGISVGPAFGVFCLICCLHFLSILIGKYFTVEGLFKKQNLLEAVVHAMENANLPYPVQDWDILRGRAEYYRVRSYRQASRKVRKEMFITITINYFWGFIKLIPIFHAGRKSSCSTVENEFYF